MRRENIMRSTFLRRVATLYPSDILEPYDVIMDLNGFDAICAFADYFNGATVYIPSKRTIFYRCLQKEVLKEFNGGNYLDLCRKYGFSERQLRRMLIGK
jgi:Mor family transcriptional regulator